LVILLSAGITRSQIPVDTVAIATVANVDTSLRIINLNPYFTIAVDSMLSYQLQINKDETRYYWYLKNSPVGLKINKDNGLLSFKADKSFFLSGKLKYDVEYTVKLGVQNLSDAREKVDERLLNSYDRIRKNYRNGLAVVPVERDACGGCFNAIPPQKQSEIKQRKKIIICENCGRILVDNDLADAVEVK